MNQESRSLFIDCLGLKHRKITAASKPNRKPKAAVMRRLRNWKPPCLGGLSHRVGVLPLLPAVKMELKMPPKTAKIMPSTGYPLLSISGINFYKRYAKIGAKAPIKREAKGSMITAADELRKMPV